MAPYSAPWSVMASAGIPRSFARVTRSRRRDRPSRRLYSLWVCRWTKFGVVIVLSGPSEEARGRTSLAGGYPRDIDHDRAMIGGRRRDGVRLRAGDADAPDVVDAPLGPVRRESGLVGARLDREVGEARSRDEVHLRRVRPRVQVAGDDRDRHVAPRVEQLADLPLTHL